MPLTLGDPPWSQLSQEALAQLWRHLVYLTTGLAQVLVNQKGSLPINNHEDSPTHGTHHLGEAWQAARVLAFSGSF